MIAQAKTKRKENPYAGLFIFTDPERNHEHMVKMEAIVAGSILTLEKEENVDIYRIGQQRLKLEAIREALKREDE